MTSTFNRRVFLNTTIIGAASFALPQISAAQAAPIVLRYANAGAPGSSEMNTIIFSDLMKREVVEKFGRLGKIYTFTTVQTSGTPEAATLLAADQVDMATFSFGALAAVTLRNVIPSGVTVVADSFQDARGFSTTFCVLADSPIKKVADLRGKRVGTNAVGSAVDVLARVFLKNSGLDPKKDLEIVELSFGNMASAIREKRIDCGAMIQPFWAVEQQKGDLRPLFTNGDALGPIQVLVHVASNNYLKKSPQAVRAFLADYYQGLDWLKDPANRKRALQIAAEVTRTPESVLGTYFMTDKDYYHTPDGCFSTDQLQKPIDAMVELGMLAKSVDASKLIDLKYLPRPCR
jgi:NitT/TauT family transport system substrate-binding protein